MSDQKSMKTEAPEVIAVPPGTDQVSCDGGGGPLGHPRIYMTFDGVDSLDCPYCDRAFVKPSAS